MAHPFANGRGLDRRRRGHRGDGRAPGSAGSRPTTATTRHASSAHAVGARRPAGAVRHRLQRLPRHRQAEPCSARTPPTPRCSPQIEDAGNQRHRGGPGVNDIVDLQVLGSVFVTLFVIMDPPGALPIFLALTGTADPEAEGRRGPPGLAGGARRSSCSSRCSASRSSIYLHISLPALQGAGGLLLLLVALQLLTGSEQEQHADAGVNVALVPLGTPLLAGPGAIVATMLAVQSADGAQPVRRRGPRSRGDDVRRLAVLPVRRAGAPPARRTAAPCSSPGSPDCCCRRSRCRWWPTASAPSSVARPNVAPMQQGKATAPGSARQGAFVQESLRGHAAPPVPREPEPPAGLGRLPAPLPHAVPRPSLARRRVRQRAHTSVGTAVHNALRDWWDLPPAQRTPDAGAELVRTLVDRRRLP